MEYWLLIPGFTAGAIVGFAAGYWFQQPEIDKARRECRHKEIALDELRKEIKKGICELATVYGPEAVINAADKLKEGV
jgi:gas vesicle protein